ncbi:DUF2335 domain-containing protein [Candidatus Cyanaurora vandensis]|uniref:DUF2335 domain-containing protein n=1 Tax=Candidatus Cyanaurora vandensis TaxID=2714958 RepID=UPI00257FF2E2|nr:DUF2335 domain-containing protein [Candidatus Cyanaurora vandensis]
MIRDPEDANDIIRTNTELSSSESENPEVSDVDSKRSLQATFYRSGPLPDANQIRQYEQIYPGAAEKIFRMAEKEQDHRQSLEKEVLQINKTSVVEEINLARTGQWMAFGLNIIVLLFGALLSWMGNDVGITIIFTSIIANAAVFLGERAVRGFIKQKEAREESGKEGEE